MDANAANGDTTNGDAVNGDTTNGYAVNEEATNGDIVSGEATNGDARGMLLRRNMVLTGKVESNTIQAWILNE